MTEVKERIGDLPAVEELPKEETKSEDGSEDEEKERKWYEYNFFFILAIFSILGFNSFFSIFCNFAYVSKEI